MQHDAWFFVGVFAFIFIIWVAVGGPSHPISFAGPFLSSPSPLGSGTYIGLPHAPFAIGDSDVELANPDTGSGSTYTSGSGTLSGGGSLAGVDFGPPSSYRGEVTMSHYVSGAGSSNPDNEYITISLASNAAAPVTLTGWSLESEASGNSAVIPAGTEVPTSGSVEALQPIILNPGDKAIVVSGASPIGASFKENECIGYFAEYQSFSPQLSNDCPSPTDTLIAEYPDYIRDTACINYVKSLPACTLEISPPPGLSSACANVLQNYLSYNGCVNAHQNDPGFVGTTWRVYLGRTTSMWRTQYEVVRLVDSQGNTVDAFSY
jgi:hypothetical protein